MNPATGEVLRTFPPLTTAELEGKLAQAAAAFEAHRQTSFAERARCMLRAAEILEADKEGCARLMTLEMGKLYRAAVAEAAKCATACRFYAENAERFLADELVRTDAGRSFVRYQPLGPVLAVMPWNFPFWQVFRFAAPALMAGNVGLLKHASNVPQCALKIEEIFRRAGFAEGVFQTLLMESGRVDAVIGDPRVAAATLTGSEDAGIKVGIAAAKQVKKTVLELGGSDSFIVMPSADLNRAVSVAVDARVQNNGQSCIAAKRFILADAIADDFERRFVERMNALRVGDPMDEGTELGPLSSAEALETLDRAVRETAAAGARLLTGGYRIERPGNYYAPTVLAEIPGNSPAYCEELFGPVASLFRAGDAAEAVRITNDSRFGLGASVWTSDPGEMEYFASEIQAGMVFVNAMVASDPRLPFGGMKHSGHGRELGAVGIREFVNIKTVWIR